VGRGGHGGRTGTILVLVGLTSILGVTFGTGFYAGRLTGPRLSAEPPVAREARRGLGGGRLAEPAGGGDMPDLTFYHELTAPLAPSPPPPKPARRPSPPAAAPTAPAAPAPAPAQTQPPAPSPSAVASISLPPPPERGPRPAPGEPSPRVRYTVQVGAYRARQPAEILRSSLVAAGHDAHVVAIDAPGGVRYRVRVGSFATREDAREAADRLTSAGVVSAFVTTRSAR
jgi:cell division septation protein DedD